MNKYDIALDLACNYNAELKEQYLKQAEKTIKSNEVVILFTTDIHTATGKLHHVTERKTELLKESRNVLLLDSGDINEKTKDVTKQMNGYYDFVVGGNHDSLCNGQNFLKRVDEADFQYIGYDLVKDGVPVFDPYVIKDYGCFKIGIIGQGRLNVSSGKWNGMKAKRDNVLLQKYVDEIRSDVDCVILLYHAGLDECRKMLKTVSGIDVVLGGHTHKIVNEVLMDKNGKCVHFAQAGVRLNCYGEMTLNDEILIELKKL